MTEAQLWGTGRAGVKQLQLIRSASWLGSWAQVKLVPAASRRSIGVAPVGSWKLKIPHGAFFPILLGARRGWSFEWRCLANMLDGLSLVDYGDRLG